MPMPEASMDKDDGSPPRQNNIRPAGQALNVQSEPKARMPKRPANLEFWLGIPAPDTGHERRALFR